MPAANIIATHDVLENSGCSFAAPSRIEPNFEAAITTTNTTNTVENKTNAHPRFSSTQLNMAEAAFSKLSGAPSPQVTTAITSAIAGMTTGQLMEPSAVSEASSTGFS